MKTLRRALLTTSLAAAACGVASANSIDFLSTPTQISGATELTYSLSLPKYPGAGTDGIPATAVLQSAKIYFFVSETVSSLTLTNTAAGAQTFTFIAGSLVNKGASNSANGADAYAPETIALFSQSMTLGGSSTSGTTCPHATPSASCDSAAFGPMTANNLSTGPTGMGGDGLTGVVKNITGSDLLTNYTGGGTFTIGGKTKAQSTFSGGGGNIATNQSTNATVEAEIDYTYTVPSGTPEPVTMALVGGGLLGLGLFGRRRKNVKS